jgi:hypothetical protein
MRNQYILKNHSPPVPLKPNLISSIVFEVLRCPKEYRRFDNMMMIFNRHPFDQLQFSRRQDPPRPDSQSLNVNLEKIDLAIDVG